MKLIKYIFSLATIGLLLVACNDDSLNPGKPVIEYHDAVTQAYFGDSLTFTVKASDVEVPLSTLKAQLFFGEEMVEETVIRTKESGKDYTGKIFVPYFANVPDGTATLKLLLQNINFTITEQEYPVAISHPQFPYLTLLLDATESEDAATSYRMEPVGDNTYSITGNFPQKVTGKIVAPKVGDNGNELVFGYANNTVTIGGESSIPFSNSREGEYTITINTYTFETSPFTVLKLNGVELETIDENTSKVDLSLINGQSLSVEGIPNFEDWWIDTDFFTKNDDGTLTFNAIAGDYRIIANQKLQYFRVEVLKDGAPASLENDGSGALWVIGADFGKPSLSNETGWVTEKAVCMAPVADKVYQMTLVGGKTVRTTSVNFKFYGGAMSWDNEFKHDRLQSNSDMILVGDETGGHDDGNLYLADSKTLKENVIYVFTVDMTGGVDNAVLTVEEKGELPFEEKQLLVNDNKMTTSDNLIYTSTISLLQGAEVEFSALDGLSEYFMDPDYFNFDIDNESISFVPVDGDYEITVNKTEKTISAQRMDNGSPASLSDDGHGAIYMMGWGCGHPSLDYQFGWEDTSKAFAMAEIQPKVYRFTAVAGPEKGSYTGQRLRTDYIDIKFFWQKGWGGEFSQGKNTQLSLKNDGTENLLKITDGGNINFADDVTLEEGTTYVFTIDLTQGNNQGTISLKKE